MFDTNLVVYPQQGWLVKIYQELFLFMPFCFSNATARVLLPVQQNPHTFIVPNEVDFCLIFTSTLLFTFIIGYHSNYNAKFKKKHSKNSDMELEITAQKAKFLVKCLK